jgi:hydroxyacylglutathione hydrolase
MPLDKLERMADQLDRTRPVAVHCQSGYRSAIAASVLERAGFLQLYNIPGGFDAWRSSGMPYAPSEPAATKDDSDETGKLQ